jgi:hypothetical protein
LEHTKSPKLYVTSGEASSLTALVSRFIFCVNFSSHVQIIMCYSKAKNHFDSGACAPAKVNLASPVYVTSIDQTPFLSRGIQCPFIKMVHNHCGQNSLHLAPDSVSCHFRDYMQSSNSFRPPTILLQLYCLNRYRNKLIARSHLSTLAILFSPSQITNAS